jgi:hypothetical protein
VRSDNEYGVVGFHGDALFFHSLIQTRISLSLIEIQIHRGILGKLGPDVNSEKWVPLTYKHLFPILPQLEANLLSNISDLSDDYANINGIAIIHPS